MSKTAADVIRIAKAEVGYREGKSDGHWNNREKYAGQVPGLEWANGQAWCAVFVSWVALQSGCAELYPSTASCDVARQWFRDRGRYSEYQAIGAQVFYGTPSDANHTGVVVAYDAETITTVEGNTNTNGSREGDGVYLKVRPRKAANVLGYGYPKFPAGIVSADPAYRKEAPKVPTKPKPARDTPNNRTRARIAAALAHPDAKAIPGTRGVVQGLLAVFRTGVKRWPVDR